MTAKSDSTFSKKELIMMIALAIVAMAVTTIAVIPSLRNSVKETLFLENREILAKVSGSLGKDGPRVTVLKIKSKNFLELEIYNMDGAEGLTLMARIPLSETRDGYFSLKGNATNLAITDVDGDGTLEVVAPTYDDQMIPRLNIYKYNPQTKGFDKVSSPEN